MLVVQPISFHNASLALILSAIRLLHGPSFKLLPDDLLQSVSWALMQSVTWALQQSVTSAFLQSVTWVLMQSVSWALLQGVTLALMQCYQGPPPSCYLGPHAKCYLGTSAKCNLGPPARCYLALLQSVAGNGLNWSLTNKMFHCVKSYMLPSQLHCTQWSFMMEVSWREL